MEYDNLIKIAKQLDKIITSERKEVKDAFRELMIVSALIEGDDIAGPLTQLVEHVSELEYEIRRLRSEMQDLAMRNRYAKYDNYPSEYDHDLHRTRIWGGIRPDDTTKDPFKHIYEKYYLTDPFKKDKEE